MKKIEISDSDKAAICTDDFSQALKGLISAQQGITREQVAILNQGRRLLDGLVIAIRRRLVQEESRR